MRSALTLTLAVGSIFGLAVAARRTIEKRRLPDVTDSAGAVTLPNGWRITPAGTHIKLPGDLPMKMVVADGGSKLLVLTAGYHDHSLNVIDLRSRELTATLDVVKAWDGMAVDPATGTVYLSGGGRAKRGFTASLERLGLSSPMTDSLDKPILRARYAAGKLAPEKALTIAGLEEKDRFISGVTLGPDGALYALNIQTDTLYRLSGADLMQQASAKTGYRPYGVVFEPDGKRLRSRIGATVRSACWMPCRCRKRPASRWAAIRMKWSGGKTAVCSWPIRDRTTSR